MQFEVDSAYDLEIVLPQRKYESIVVENPSSGNVEMHGFYRSQGEICTELKNGIFGVFKSTVRSENKIQKLKTALVVFEHPTSLSSTIAR